MARHSGRSCPSRSFCVARDGDRAVQSLAAGQPLVYNRRGNWQGNVLKTYVINLARSKDRRAFQEKQLAALGVEHEFVPAVDGQLLGPEHHVDSLAPGIVGCVLSHIATFRQILADGHAAAVVIEDDAILPPNFNPLLESLAPALSGAEAALLH